MYAGIPAEDDQQIDAPVVHVVHELAERLQLVGGDGLHGIGVDDGRPGIAEGGVQGVRQRVHGCGLLVARDDHAGAAVRLQILRGGRDPFVDVGTARRWGATCARDGGVERARNRVDLARARGQPVIRHRAGR